MKSFKEFFEANVQEVTFAFGRFNPMSIGHSKLLDKVASLNTSYRIYPSHTQDSKKNPLSAEQKVKYMRAMFPQHARYIVFDRSIKTAIDALVSLYREGFTKVNLVVGADRMRDFEFLRKYNGVEGRHGFYDFPDGIFFISAGARDPDSDDIVTGMSASKLRKAAQEGNFKEFLLGMPSGFKLAEQLFNDVRQGMGLKPITNFREHIRLEKVSDIREKYVHNQIFRIGDHIDTPDGLTTVKERKPNYVVAENGNKYFLNVIKEHHA